MARWLRRGDALVEMGAVRFLAADASSPAIGTRLLVDDGSAAD